MTTIAAPATALYPAGVAVIRISGPGSAAILSGIFKSRQSPIQHPHQLIFGKIVDPASGNVLDTCLAVYMPAPRSFTGEDTVELQIHGSPLIAKNVLGVVYSAGARPAEPGEFSKRAYLNGKLDLVQAEALCDLINATSEQALKIAQEQLEGRFSKVITELGEPLRDLLAEIEATIDFPEEDIQPEVKERFNLVTENAVDTIKCLLASYSYGHVMRDGFRVLLCGPPNVGKSSILNTLLGEDRVIVSEESGTTRDLIEEHVLISNYRFVFCDSAGIRDNPGKIEQRGIELAKSKVTWADLVLFVVDAGDKDTLYSEILEDLRNKAKNLWMVVNKIDAYPDAVGNIICDSNVCSRTIYVSAKTVEGLSALREALVETIESGMPDNLEGGAVVTNERHRLALRRARRSLELARDAFKDSLPLELVSSELRIALTALEELIGITTTEDILGRIFSKFCIGK
ncbi:MAG: tRNA uridine-5-carboxymethylaminomethyl(34) synthesis GTPase MnmE [Candidatus Dadabacteria bacterium]|nr:MAG: tRNA uridine-5-carboxymethylaminomethyl(34) synthesis GTPase MnmE [Candidatus Dadabacteria bacterium]